MAALMVAIEKERITQIKLLLSGKDSCLSFINKDGQTLLVKSCQIKTAWKALAVSKMLLDIGGEVLVNKLDKWNRTCLTYACIDGKADLIELILDTGDIAPNTIDNTGHTNLMYVVLSGIENAVLKLLHYLRKYNLSLDERTQDGFTAYMLALKNGHLKIAFLLKSNAASCDTFDFKYHRKSVKWAKYNQLPRTLPEVTSSSRKQRQTGFGDLPPPRRRSMTAPCFRNMEYLNFLHHTIQPKSASIADSVKMLGIIDMTKNIKINTNNNKDNKNKTSDNDIGFLPSTPRSQPLTGIQENLPMDSQTLQKIPSRPISRLLNSILVECVLMKRDCEEKRIRIERARSERKGFHTPIINTRRKSTSRRSFSSLC